MIVTMSVSFAIGHTPLFVDVRTIETDPVVISVLLGKYVVVELVEGAKVPVPLLDHRIMLGKGLTVPLRFTKLLLAHTVLSLPAKASEAF